MGRDDNITPIPSLLGREHGCQCAARILQDPGRHKESVHLICVGLQFPEQGWARSRLNRY